LCVVATGEEGFEIMKIMVINNDLVAEYLNGIKCLLRIVSLVKA
jgi:hypothetical protein